MSRYKQQRKHKFIESIPQVSLDNSTNNLPIRCKFNFGYMDFSQRAGQHFKDWTNKQLIHLLEELFEFSKEPLAHWLKMTIGSGRHCQHVFEIYDSFPLNSDFKRPSYIPHQAKWARFRLDSRGRLIGFILPEKYRNLFKKESNCYFDTNTFYVVFLDKDHKFYKTRKR